MEYSLLCPTRLREQSLYNYLNSVLKTTKNKQEVEILIAVDEDDPNTRQTAERYKREFRNLNIKIFKRIHSDFVNRDYYNWLAERAEGKYIWVNGDDLLLIVPNWDVIIKKRIEDYLVDKPDRIMCAGIKDNTPKPKPTLPMFPCFPLVTKEALDYFKFVLHPFVPTWGADYLLYLLYTGADRYLEVKDTVYLKHISWHTRAVNKDSTAKGVEYTFNQLKLLPEHNIDRHAALTIPAQAAKLKDYIANYKENV